MITKGLHLMDCAKGMKKIRKGSIDLIFTDPPYISDLWEEAYTKLGTGAMRILKPSGFCITYTPQYRLPSILKIMEGSGLEYFWIVPQLQLSQCTALVHQRNAICLHKPILIFSKPPMVKPPRVFVDVVRGKRQKEYHAWQQSIHEVLGIVSRFADPGQLLCDPFTGSGTSLLAAKLLGLRWIGFENNEDTYKIALMRLEQQPLDLSSFELGEVPA